MDLSILQGLVDLHAAELALKVNGRLKKMVYEDVIRNTRVGCHLKQAVFKLSTYRIKISPQTPLNGDCPIFIAKLYSAVADCRDIRCCDNEASQSLQIACFYTARQTTPSGECK